MKKLFPLLIVAVCFVNASPYTKQTHKNNILDIQSHVKRVIQNDISIEPWTYSESFKTRDLGAWAAYPLWQDNAYDPDFRVGKIVPGDSNLSIVAEVTPYSHVDNYVGAQKLLNMYITPGSNLKFRYYLKTNLNVRYLKVRFAAGKYGKIDYTISDPQTNKWTWVTLNFEDFAKQNPDIASKKRVRIYALAFLAKIPKADPAMPIYLGLDDITFHGEHSTPFKFIEPDIYKLPEFKPYIPQKDYHTGDSFKLRGTWDVKAKKVRISIVSYTNKNKSYYKGRLFKRDGMWVLKPLKLSFPDGLYLGRLTAYDGSIRLSETEFTIFIVPSNMKGEHPRLLFDTSKEVRMKKRFDEKRFQTVYKNIEVNAQKLRKEIPLKSLVFDLDQFPVKHWLPSWDAFGRHIYNTGPALKWNALAYTFHNDTTAGEYAKNMLLKLSGWPIWVAPWLIKHGIYDDHRMGTWSHRVALAYDLTYNLMTPDERQKVRNAIMNKIVKGAFRTWVYNDYVTSNTSNWIGHTVGGALMNMAAIFEDGPKTANLEPYLTGSLMKFYAYITHVTDSKDGSWGEGWGYNNYAFSNMTYSVPSLLNVFNVNVTTPLDRTYNEYIWGGLIKDKKWFGYGDSENNIGPATNWAFLLAMHKNPLLSWYYNYMKEGETFDDILFNTGDIPQKSPFNENPDKVFHKIGTTIFKSGWGKDAFAFDMRTGPFYNHQHLDQGSFYLADHGVIFIEDKPINKSDYYKDPLYQSRFIQPIAHSTILINGNHQSQRVGDPYNFAPGFNDYAFIRQYLDGKDAAFSSGSIGRLYWGKVKSLTRNVLYLKPRTLLMLDIAVPNNDKNVNVTLLYHTAHLKDIEADAGRHISKITRGGYSLNIVHLTPESENVKAVETPHFLKSLLHDKPLVKNGMLMVTAHTNDKPLVMANLLISTSAGKSPDVTYSHGDGFISGSVRGKKFAFTTSPGHIYKTGEFKTDALAMTWNQENDFIAMATELSKNGEILFKSDVPATAEIYNGGVKCYLSKKSKIILHARNKPSRIRINGKFTKHFDYSRKNKTVEFEAPEGKDVIILR